VHAGVSQKKQRSTVATKMTFDYEHSSDYRVHHCHGVFGGLTPRGEVQMSFWNDMQMVPKRCVFNILDGTTLGDERKDERSPQEDPRAPRAVRHVPVTVIMPMDDVRKFVGWLQERIAELEEIERERGTALAQPTDDGNGSVDTPVCQAED
jgi:hypothetical protein